MARQYEVRASTRRVNRFTSWLARRGIGRTEVLITVGRRSGQTRTVPISPIKFQDEEYLVAPYGESEWVHNVRAHPDAVLRHGSEARKIRLEEVMGDETAPVVAAYHAREGYARMYMEVPQIRRSKIFVVRAAYFPFSG